MTDGGGGGHAHTAGAAGGSTLANPTGTAADVGALCFCPEAFLPGRWQPGQILKA